MSWTAGAWKPWTDDNGQTGGYLVKFKQNNNDSMW